MSDRDKWNARYAASPRSDALEPDAIVIEAIRGRTPGNALDVACGTGGNSIYLARQGWSVTAIDISDVALDTLKQRAAAERLDIRTVAADLTDSATVLRHAAFDLICDCRYLQRDLFPSLIRALRPGGILVVLVPMHDDDPAVRAMSVEYLVSSGELPELLNELHIVTYRETKEGAGKRKLGEYIGAKKEFS